MTLYNNRTFTVAPSGSYDQAHAMCRQHGHMQPDQRGKCLRCGEKVGALADAEATELGRL